MYQTQLSTARQGADAGYVDYSQPPGSGWRAFAGTMIIIGAMLNFVDGITAISDAKYFKEVSGQSVHLPATDNLHAWGWAAVAIAAVMLFAGIGIFFGWMWARVVGVVIASFNLVFQLAFLAHFPFWSFTMILVDILVIYGLVVHGAHIDEETVVLAE